MVTKIDIFTALSINGYITSFDDFDIFKKLSNHKVLKFRDSMRSKYEAILVGANTIHKDNPKLLSSKMTNSRVIVDKYENIDLDSQIFRVLPHQTILILRGRNSKYVRKLTEKGVNVITQSKLDPISIVSTLRSINIRSLLIEGGSKTISEFLESGVVNSISLVYFPFICNVNGIAINTTHVFEKIQTIETLRGISNNVFLAQYLLKKPKP